MSQLKFRYLNAPKTKNYLEIQKSVNVLFGIIEEYGRLEKLHFQMKNQDCEKLVCK